MTVEQAVMFERLGSLDLDQRQLAVYDRPIGLRLLYQDPHTGAEHYLVRYPAGLRAQRHRHTAAQTVVVLDGSLQADDTVLGPGSYCHFPAGASMYHAPADEQSCLFVTIFHGPFDVDPIDEPGR